MTFDEKPAAALVPGDQVVQRDGSKLSRANLLTIDRVEQNGDDVLVTFAKSKGQHHYHASARIVVLPKVERVGWWENK